MNRPDHPAGPYVAIATPTPAQREEMLAVLRTFPARLRKAVAGLNDKQLETKYRNWTLRQIVNHLADSHVNAYVRFRLALTETQPPSSPTTNPPGPTSRNRRPPTFSSRCNCSTPSTPAGCARSRP
jgi:hypothetical protein